ncbi:MAG TPA: phage tail sheath subtilisin-like domain-containing protein [Myxococcota bacterium]|nr:phage tail sheath subtilisin-like domain-containing protein [Myxococcota bacterium]
MAAASVGVWGNGLRVRFGASSDGDSTRFSLVVYYRAPGSGNDVVLERFDRLSLVATDAQAAARVLERSAVLRWTGAASLALTDLPIPANTTSNQAQLAGGVGGGAAFAWTLTDLKPLDAIDDAALLLAAPSAAINPPPSNAPQGNVQSDVWALFAGYVEARPLGDLFYVADLPRSATSGAVDQATDDVIAAYNLLQKSSRVAGYWPFVRIADPVVSGAGLFVPPSGFVAGLYARTDARRGVWKAPAGTDGQVLGVLGLEFKLLDAQQDRLNPRGINGLRQLPGAGAVVWGARTTQPDSEWRYVPVRRTAIFLAESIRTSIQWAVFEPNSPTLWQALRVTVEAFMSGLHRQGAFASPAASEAYFVRCDATTTTEADRLAGIVNVVVAFAPLRPAEFVVVKLSQKTALSA